MTIECDRETLSILLPDQKLGTAKLMTDLIAALKQNTDLLHLNLRNNNICHEGIDLIFTFMQRHRIYVYTLDLSFNIIHTNYNALCNYIDDAYKLNYLNLESTKIDTYGMRIICDALYQKYNLEYVNASDCYLDDAVCADLIIVLHSCKKMKHLYIQNNRIEHPDLLKEIVRIYDITYEIHM